MVPRALAPGAGRSYAAAVGTSILGTAVRRVEDPDLVTGRGTFVDDLVASGEVAGVLHAVFVRCRSPHATITAVDTDAAAGARASPWSSPAPTWPTRPVPLFAQANAEVRRRALAGDRVRYVGDPVALVVADTVARARGRRRPRRRGLRGPARRWSTWRPPSRRGAPQQSTSAAPGNVALRRTRRGRPAGGRRGRRARADREQPARRRADRAPRGPGRPAAAGRVRHGAARPHRLGLHPAPAPRPSGCWPAARAWTPSAVRVVAPHVGGAFGGKAGSSPDHAAVASPPPRLGRPVAWVETRSRGDAVDAGPRAGAVRRARARPATGGSPACGPGWWATAAPTAASAAPSRPGSTRTMGQGPYVVPRVRWDAVGCSPTPPPWAPSAAPAGPRRRRMLERAAGPRRRRARAGARGAPPPQLRAPRRVPLHHARPGPPTTPATTTAPLDEALRVADVDGCRRRAGAAPARPATPASSASASPPTSRSPASAGSELGRVEVARRRLGHRAGRHLGARAGPRHRRSR